MSSAYNVAVALAVIVTCLSIINAMREGLTVIYHRGIYECDRGRTHDGPCRGKLTISTPTERPTCRCESTGPGTLSTPDPLCPWHRGFMPTADVASPGLP